MNYYQLSKMKKRYPILKKISDFQTDGITQYLYWDVNRIENIIAVIRLYEAYDKRTSS